MEVGGDVLGDAGLVLIEGVEVAGPVSAAVQ
jgi:hypothetical protein